MAEVLHTEVCVLGGGPGGSTTAMQLAKRGITAILLEKSTFPRDKVCGDALSGKVMRTLERLDPELCAEVKRDARGMPSWGVTFVAPSGRSLRVPFSRETGLGEAPGVILPRLHFDEHLFRRACTATGIHVIEGTTAKTFTRTATGWTIGTTTAQGQGQSITCKMMHRCRRRQLSAFARHVAELAAGTSKHHAAGVRAYYSGAFRASTRRASSNCIS
jgi:flavin-dependent dehydrogenase